MKALAKIDKQVVNFSKNYSLPLLRLSLGIIFLWFGFLKFFPGASPAEELAGNTIYILSFGLLSPSLANFILAIWESAIGLGFLLNRHIKFIVYIMILQMIGTFTPLLLFPDLTWQALPYAATLEGQYIIKNIVLMSGALVLLSKSGNQS